MITLQRPVQSPAAGIIQSGEKVLQTAGGINAAGGVFANGVGPMMVPFNANPVNFTGYEDFFFGPNGSMPNTTLWSLSSTHPTGSFGIKDQAFEVYNKEPGDDSFKATSLFLKNTPNVGDFDIVLDWAISDYVLGSADPSNYRSISLTIIDNAAPGLFAMESFYDDAGVFSHGLYSFSDDSTDATYSKPVSKFRLQRVGTVMKAWLWNDDTSQWEWNGLTAGFTFTDASLPGSVFDVEVGVFTDGAGDARFRINELSFNQSPVTMTPGNQFLPWLPNAIAVDYVTGINYRWDLATGAWVAIP